MIPERLKPGDTIGIISPSGPVLKNSRQQLKSGIDFFKRTGFNVKIAKNALKNTLKYSATPEEKAEDLNSMFKDDFIKAVICSQGGFNSNSILPLIDFNALQENPKIFLGISDITVLLNAIYKETGLVTFHGNDVIWGFGRTPTKYDINEFYERLIEGKIGEINHNSKWTCVRKGTSEGILIGGNLDCLNKLAGTKYFPELKNKILVLESYDGSSDPESVELELYRLKQMGAFEKIKGLWLGHYNNKSKISYEEIVMNVVKEFDFPILKCDDFGHNTPNTTIPVGAKVRLDATNKKLRILERCVK